LPDGRYFLLSDTVGFIHKLPPTVVAAFRATLEELQNAALLLHVVDITHPEASKHCEAVDKILSELGLAKRPRLTVLNKMDLVVDSEDDLMNLDLHSRLGELAGVRPDDIVFISAARGWGFTGLLQKIAAILATAVTPTAKSGDV